MATKSLFWFCVAAGAEGSKLIWTCWAPPPPPPPPLVPYPEEGAEEEEEEPEDDAKLLWP